MLFFPSNFLMAVDLNKYKLQLASSFLIVLTHYQIYSETESEEVENL